MAPRLHCEALYGVPTEMPHGDNAELANLEADSEVNVRKSKQDFINNFQVEKLKSFW